MLEYGKQVPACEFVLPPLTFQYRTYNRAAIAVTRVMQN